MKQFEKWKDDNCVKHCNLCYIGVCGDCRGIGTKADTWKAALKCVRDEMLPNCHEPMDIYDFIEEELDEK